MSDQQYMSEALRLAAEGLGRVAPNPSVGCLIVKDGVIVGKGRTADGGRPHAEVVALEQAGDKAKGATVYVTLEPCCHHGKTSLPCTDALIAAQVGKVVVACKDENKRVFGQGIKALQDAGIEVSVGLMEKEARELNDGFFKRINNFRPLVTLKMATSIDSKLSLKPDQNFRLTSDEAKARVHAERSIHDAIMTGIGTVLADDPLLTTRINGHFHKSVRVILDTHLRFPLIAKMLKTKDLGDIWIFTAPKSDEGKKNALEASGIRVVEMDLSANGRVSLPFVLEYLAEHGITRLMVEAGQNVLTAFLKFKIWDHLLIFRAPIIIGSAGVDAFGDLEMDDAAKAPRPVLVSIEQHGDDLLEIYKRA